MPLSRFRFLCALGLIAAGTSGVGLLVLNKTSLVERHVEARLPVIATDMLTSPSGAVLLAGNSHAEIAGHSGLPNCTPWVNAGIAGTKARNYRTAIERITAPARFRSAVLFIGTNDIMRRDKPLSQSSKSRFAADVSYILGWLRGRADEVIVAAVPPIGAAATRRREPAAVSVYSDILRRLCQSSGCRFEDPFIGMRGDGNALAGDEALPDAIHLADYPAMLHNLNICPDIGRRS